MPEEAFGKVLDRRKAGQGVKTEAADHGAKNPNIKNPEPKIRHIIAPTRRIDEIGSGIPFEEIYSTVLSKPIILPGMAEMKIAEIATLEKKSKKDLILLFFKK